MRHWFARLGLTAALLLALVAPALAAIGNPVTIGSIKTENATTTSLVFTTNVNINAGDFVLCTLSMGSGGVSILTAVDSGAVNVWTIVNLNTGAPSAEYAYVANASAVASGGTITFGYNSTGGRKMMGCVSVTGIVTSTPRDTTATSTSNAATNTSATTINSGALATNVEVLFAGIHAMAGTDFGAFTPPGSWVQVLTASGANGSMRLCYQIVASQGSVAWSPTWATSVAYRSFAVLAFKGIGGTSSNNGMLLGIGP